MSVSMWMKSDAWRIKAGAKATGCLRGNKNVRTAMPFIRFDRGGLPIFAGQQIDVFIDAPERNVLPTAKAGQLLPRGG